MAALRPPAWRLLVLLCLLAAVAASPALAQCPAGTARVGTNTTCTGCAKGSFSAGGTAPCTACPPCYTTPGVNSTSNASCVCSPGCGRNATGLCSVCGAGFYSAGGVMTNKVPSCKRCAAGKTTNGTTRTSAAACNVCLPGYGGKNCLACARGSWSAGGNASAGGNLTPNCTTCAAGTTTASTASTRASNCNWCAPGFGVVNATSAACAACPPGSWSAGGVAGNLKPNCTRCDAGTTTDGPGRASKSACTICAPGFGFAIVRNVSVCQICARGRWSAGGNATAPKPLCTACNNGFTTAAAGSAANASCTVRICAAGRGSNATCPLCPRGTWAAAGTAAAPVPTCTPCGPNTTTPSTGASSSSACSVCLPGYGKLGTASRCDICPVNTFSPGGNRINPRPNCTACPAGTFAAAPGATACETAPPPSGGCTVNSPACGWPQRCDLTAPAANTTGGVCRASFLCPTCPRGYECVSIAAALAFPGAMPWCIKKTTCDPPCAADEFCDPGRSLMLPASCRKITDKCPLGCPAGMACDANRSLCAFTCTARGGQCDAPNRSFYTLPQFCDETTGLCLQDGCQYNNGTGLARGCAPGFACKQLFVGGPRACFSTTCSKNCTAPRTCGETADGTMDCVDARCSPPCGPDKACDPAANKCVQGCGGGPPCAANEVCKNGTCAPPACSPPCNPLEMCVFNATTGNDTCAWKCMFGCPAGLTCDPDYSVCRPMTCSPACPAGYACANVTGRPTCRPSCDPACGAGLTCDLAASPPKCILPNPANFNLVLRIGERFARGALWEVDLSSEIAAPIGFLDKHITGSQIADLHGGCTSADLGDYGHHDGGKETWMESFVTSVFVDAGGILGTVRQNWREVIVDVGGALAAGDWSGEADVRVFARSLNVYDQSYRLQPARPLELQVGLRHKATGVTYAESYTTISTLGINASPENEPCYHHSDALSAVITVTTTPAKDRLAYSLNIIKPYDPSSAPAAAASSAAALSDDLLPADGGAVIGQITPQIAARLADIRKARQERRERRRAGESPGAGAGPAPEQGAPEQGARRR